MREGNENHLITSVRRPFTYGCSFYDGVLRGPVLAPNLSHGRCPSAHSREF